MSLLAIPHHLIPILKAETTQTIDILDLKDTFENINEGLSRHNDPRLWTLKLEFTKLFTMVSTSQSSQNA